MSSRAALAWTLAATVAALVPSVARAQDGSGLGTPATGGTTATTTTPATALTPPRGLVGAERVHSYRDTPGPTQLTLQPPPLFRGPDIELFAARNVDSIGSQVFDWGGGGAMYVESMPWHFLGVQLGAAIFGLSAGRGLDPTMPTSPGYWWGLRFGLRLHMADLLGWNDLDWWIDVHDSFGRSDRITEHGLDAGMGLAFIVDDLIALGPFFRFVFLNDPLTNYPMLLTFGLDVELQPPRRRYVTHDVAEQTIAGGDPHHHAHEFSMEQTDVAPRGPVIDHEPLVLDFEAYAQRSLDKTGAAELGWGGGLAPQLEIVLAKEFGLHIGGAFSLIAQNATAANPHPDPVWTFSSRVGFRFHWTALANLSFGDGWIDAHHEFIVSNGVARNGFDFGTGLDFFVSRYFSIGPFVRFVLADDPTGENPVFILFGLDIGLMPQLRGGVEIADRDHDGIPDEHDSCPNQAAGAHADRDNPGCPDRDADGDGLRDDMDECPSESSGAHPDRLHPGCPLPDRDGDGVPNSEDFCPDVPSTGNDDSLREGCPRSS